MTNLIFPNDIPSKANPVDADILLIADSADNSELKQITIGSITTDIGDGLIVDASASTTTTYSSDKINTLNGTQDSTISSNYSTLNTNKLNRNAQLRTGNTAWRLPYNGASGNEVELALGASGTVLQSSGASSAPTWVAPSVDINGQTEDTTGDMDADFALVYDTSAGANRKQKVNVFKASDAEALAGTVTNKFVTPKQVKDNYFQGTKLVTNYSFTTSSEVTAQTFTVPANALGTNGMLEVRGGLNLVCSGGGSMTVTVRIKYGGTTLCTLVTPNVGAGDTDIATFSATLFNNSSTSSQLAYFSLSHFGAGDSSDTTDIARGTSAIDSTASQDLVITVQGSTYTTTGTAINIATTLINN